MKKFKYPDTEYNNFGVAFNGEFYAGDLTQSGKKIHPLGKDILHTRESYLHSRKHSRRDSTWVGFSNLVPNVRGATLFNHNPNTSIDFSYPKGLRGHAPLSVFTSTMGITAGKTYYPTGTGIILDENDDIAYNVQTNGRGNESLSSTVPLTSDNNGYNGPAYVVFETVNRLYVHVQSYYTGYSSLIWINKLQRSGVTNIGSVIAGRFDFEYMGKDEADRNVFILLFDRYTTSEVGAISTSPHLTSTLNGQTYAAVIRETSPNSDYFSAEIRFNYAATNTDGTTSYRTVSHLQFSASNAYKELDANGRLLGFSFATHAMGNTGTDSALTVHQGWFNWTKFTLSPTGTTQTHTRVDLPASLNKPVRVVSTNRPGITIQCTQWVKGNKAYAVFSNGSGRRNLRNNDTSTEIPDYPIVIMEADLNASGNIIGSPRFTDVPVDVGPGFYIAMLDRERNMLWWLSDEAISGNNFIVRSLDVDNRFVDYNSFADSFQSAGCHDGKLLVVVVGQTAAVHKYVMEPGSHRVLVNLEFDKTLYSKGDAATLVVTHNSPRPLQAVVELEGCVFQDGTDSKTVQLTPGTPLNLSVLIQKVARATVSRIEYAIAEAPAQEPSA